MSLLQRGINPVGLKVVILGFAFKENCPDIRNTKVIDLYRELQKMNMEVEIYDPVVDAEEAMAEYDLALVDHDGINADVGLLAVPHKRILEQLQSEALRFSLDYCYDFKKLLTEQL